MSFPPRPPIGMPPLGGMPHTGQPPPLLPPFGHYPSMPPMGMNPMMRPPMMAPNGAPPNFNMMNQIIPNIPDKAAPVTTVFVGNISERVPDSMIRAMLQRCGNVLNWKRVAGPSGKMQGFGFCDFDNPVATLRVIRLLNGYEIADKKLLVKVDQKTQELLSDYIKKMKENAKGPLSKNAKKAAMLKNLSSGKLDQESENGGEEGSNKSTINLLNLELIDENTLKEDRIVLNTFELIYKQYEKELQPPAPVEQQPATTEAAKKEEVSKKDTSPAPPSIVEKEKEEAKDRDRDRDRERDRERERERERDRNKDRERDRDRDTKLPRVNSSSSSIRSPDRHRSHYDESRSPRNSRSPESRYTRARERSPLTRNNSNISARDEPVYNKENRNGSSVIEDEETRERKKLERRLREKEMAYRERLKNWETREDKRRKEYQIEKKKEIQRKKLLQKDAKKLRQFLEDYDDEKDDSIHYKGSNLEKKLKLREKEIESDNKDRLKEKEELEELKKKLIDKGLSDVETEAQRIQNDENMKLKMKFEKLEESSSSSEDESESDSEQNKIDRPLSSALMPTSASETKLENENNIVSNNDNERNMDIEEKDEKDVNSNENENKNELDGESSKTEIPLPVPPPQLYSEESNISQPQSVTTNDENTKLDDNHYQSSSSLLEGLNSQVSSQLNELSSQLDKQSSNGDYSPGYSNSPIFSQSNSDIAHSFTGIKATSVTIKSVNTKNKFIAPKNQLFADEEEDQTTVKKAKLSASALLESKSQAEEKRKAVKKLVESIPTDKDELFAYPIDWSQLDQSLMDKRIRPWINKKIIEYIGEEEQSLNDFICTKIEQHSKPDKLLEEVKVILDEEAELFVKKMWRLIVYETESKRCGLSK